MSRRPPTAPFPCSKVCDLRRDLPHLVPFYHQLDSIGDVLAGQHPIRRWEYAMALRAIQEWLEAAQQALAAAVVQEVAAAGYPGATVEGVERLTPLAVCDVGGAGSNFWKALLTITGGQIVVLDPDLSHGGGSLPELRVGVTATKDTVEHYATIAHPNQFDILTSISVIEHVEHVRPFLRTIHMLLKPGGLLFLTTDYWDAEGPDTAHFHWMRRRIYNADLMRGLIQKAREVGFKSFGTSDWYYPGPMLYDYNVASLALVKA